MKSKSIYKKSTGQFTGVIIRVPESDIAGNLGPDEAVKEGAFDHLSQRVNVETGEIVDWQPDPPDGDHYWMHDDEAGNRVRRWVLRADEVTRRARRDAARARINELDRKVPRALLEHALGIVPTQDDRAAGAMTLQEIQGELASLRPEVR